MAMLFNATADIFVEACFNVPTLGTLYKAATLAAIRERGIPHPHAAPMGAD